MVAHHAPLSMGFPRQEYWSGLPTFFPSPGDLPDPGIKLASSVFSGKLFTIETLGKPKVLITCYIKAIPTLEIHIFRDK